MTEDIRFAFRLFRKNPMFLAVASGSLAVGVAINVVMFGVVNAVLLRPLPVPDAARVVGIGAAVDRGIVGLSHPQFSVVRDGLDVFEGVVARRFNSVVVNLGDGPREVAAEFVSANYLSILRVAPTIGRDFRSQEDSEGAPAVVVISHRMWERQLSRARDVLGRTVVLGGLPATVIGVAPPGFNGTFPGIAMEIWVPVSHNDRLLPGRGSLNDPEARFLQVFARLRDGVSRVEAQAQVEAIARRIEPPEQARGRWRLTVIETTGVIPMIASIAGPFLSILMGAVGLVLLIACANVAGLLSARGEERRREIAVRAAMGASRPRLLRQLLVENLSLALIGGLGGVMLSSIGFGIVRRYQPTMGSVPVQFDAGIDIRVLTFSLGIAIATGLIFGLLPAIRTARTDLVTVIKQQTGAGGRRGKWLRSGLVVGQVALSAVLLVASGLLIRGLLVGSRIDPGFDSHGIAVARLAPELVGYGEPEARGLWTTMANRLSSSPVVEGVAFGRFVPLGGGADQMEVLLPGNELGESSAAWPRVQYNIVDPEYFSLLDIPVRNGRNFATADDGGAPPVVIVNETLAGDLQGSRAAIGESLRVRGRDGLERTVIVVGVVADVKFRRLSEDPTPVMFFPMAQVYSPGMQLHVRTNAAAAATAALVIDMTRALDSELPVEVESMRDLMGFALLPTKIAGLVLAVAGSMALLLAASGLFAVVSYTAARRLREIGIRVALGATTANVGRLVLWHGVRLTVIGLAIGALAAFMLGHLLSSLLVGVSSADPVAFGACGLLLAAVSVAAGFLPARRAALADPVRVLRAE